MNNKTYITIDGSVYEKISDNCVDVELSLPLDIYENLESLVEDGQFVSIQDAIRCILRDYISEMDL